MKKLLFTILSVVVLVVQSNGAFALASENPDVILSVIDDVVNSRNYWVYSTGKVRPECVALWNVATMLNQFGGFDYFGTRNVSQQDALNFCYYTMGFNPSWMYGRPEMMDGAACSWNDTYGEDKYGIAKEDMWKYAAGACYVYLTRYKGNSTSQPLFELNRNVDKLVDGSVTKPLGYFCADRDNLGGNTMFWSHAKKYALPGQYECSENNATYREVIALFAQLFVYDRVLQNLVESRDVEGILSYGDKHICQELLGSGELYGVCEQYFGPDAWAVFWLDPLENYLHNYFNYIVYGNVKAVLDLFFEQWYDTSIDRLKARCGDLWGMSSEEQRVRCAEFWWYHMRSDNNVSCQRVFCNDSEKSYGTYWCSRCPTSGLGSDVVFEPSYKKFVDDCAFMGTTTGLKDTTGIYNSGGRCQWSSIK